MKISNSTILITGGSSGIGKETAKQFVKKGAKVLITGRNEVKLNNVANEIGAIPLLFDISQLDTIALLAEKAIVLLGGRIDVLVNNAGIGLFPKLGEINKEDLQSVYSTNVLGLHQRSGANPHNLRPKDRRYKIKGRFSFLFRGSGPAITEL